MTKPHTQYPTPPQQLNDVQPSFTTCGARSGGCKCQLSAGHEGEHVDCLHMHAWPRSIVGAKKWDDVIISAVIVIALLLWLAVSQ